MPLKSIKDYENVKGFSDEEKFLRILNKNFNYGNKLAKLLQEKLDGFYFAASGEAFIEISEQILEELGKDLVDKYFSLYKNKLGSRGMGYYGLFGTAYLVENRENFYKGEKIKESWDSFWKEYEEYINLLDKMKNYRELDIIYLDNYRNFLLLWIYILLIFKFSNKEKYKLKPIKNFVLTISNKNIAYLDTILNFLINQYESVLDNYIKVVTDQSGLTSKNMNIKQSFEEIKKFMKTFSISTKKGKKTIEQAILSNSSFFNTWFEKIFRNVRELDNLAHVFSVILGKIDLKLLENKQDIYKLICKEKQKVEKKMNNDTTYVSVMYGGIEIAMVAKYLGYKAGLVLYSNYHLEQKDSYVNVNDVIFSLAGEQLNSKSKVVIFDDNFFTGRTLEKVVSVFLNNQIAVKQVACSKVSLPEFVRRELKNNSFSNKKDYTAIANFELLKHIALNAFYLSERLTRKNRNVNLFSLKKVIWFRRKRGKEFRSL